MEEISDCLDSFGWYEDILESQHENHSGFKSKLSSLSSFGSEESFPRLHYGLISDDDGSLTTISLESSVLFTFSNFSSAIACRSFESTSVWVSIKSLRIVQSTKEGVFVEFLVSLIVNGQAFSSWKRFTDFRQLAQICGISTGITRHLFPTPKGVLPSSSALWSRFEEERHWCRTLSMDYLMWKCLSLEKFLESLLFELYEPVALISFVTTVYEPVPAR